MSLHALGRRSSRNNAWQIVRIMIIPKTTQSLSSLYVILLEEGANSYGDYPTYTILDRIVRGEMREGSLLDVWELRNRR